MTCGPGIMRWVRELDSVRNDPCVFAERVLGWTLNPHQREMFKHSMGLISEL